MFDRRVAVAVATRGRQLFDDQVNTPPVAESLAVNGSDVPVVTVTPVTPAAPGQIDEASSRQTGGEEAAGCQTGVRRRRAERAAIGQRAHETGVGEVCCVRGEDGLGDLGSVELTADEFVGRRRFADVGNVLVVVDARCCRRCRIDVDEYGFAFAASTANL